MISTAIKFVLASGVAAAMAFQGSVGAAGPPAAKKRVLMVQGKAADAPAEPDASAISLPIHDLPVHDLPIQQLPVQPLPAPNPPEHEPQGSHELAARAFAVEVIRLSAEADAIDRLWQVYKADCGVRVGREYTFGREWFALWDRAAQPTIEARGCSDLLWRLLRGGERVRHDLTRARTTAHAALDPGTEIGMLRWHSLQWP